MEQMRKVEKQVIEAFLCGEKKSVTNTTTDGQSLWLFGHKIARRTDRHDVFEVNFCGYPTATTQSRLNSLCESIGMKRPFQIRNGVVSLIGVDTSNGKTTKTKYSSNEWIRIKA
jgi:hypothetical protein